jgi:hypothetical protein
LKERALLHQIIMGRLAGVKSSPLRVERGEDDSAHGRMTLVYVV